jgi:hypothetical protein
LVDELIDVARTHAEALGRVGSGDALHGEQPMRV